MITFPLLYYPRRGMQKYHELPIRHRPDKRSVIRQTPQHYYRALLVMVMKNLLSPG
ncbi:hypothetical protein KCP78_20750 [Salmonella enterica subsp. enterica]|nr:hypothetical protein KCP78_20750 [Salmonella enterica subsp. enterica]